MTEPVLAFVGVGGNIDPESVVPDGVRALEDRFGALECSPVYRSAAVGFDGDDFLNLVVAFPTSLAPDALVAALREVEAGFGRARRPGSLDSRTLDLDLLLYGDACIAEVGVPRADILEHAFVLKPLADIAGERCHPVVGLTYRALWEAFDGDRADLRPAEAGAAACR